MPLLPPRLHHAEMTSARGCACARALAKRRQPNTARLSFPPIRLLHRNERHHHAAPSTRRPSTSRPSHRRTRRVRCPRTDDPGHQGEGIHLLWGRLCVGMVTGGCTPGWCTVSARQYASRPDFAGLPGQQRQRQQWRGRVPRRRKSHELL